MRPRTSRGPNAVLERLLAAETMTSLAGAREGAAQSLARKARRVFSLPGATAYVSSSDAAFALPDGPEVDRVLGLLQTSAPSILLVAQDDHVAETSWLMQDELTARLVDSEGWQSHLDVARSLLRQVAADLNVGFVPTCPGLGEWSNIHTYPPVPPADTLTSAFFNSRRLWPVRVADAYGLQLLTAEHLECANDLSGRGVAHACAPSPRRAGTRARELLVRHADPSDARCIPKRGQNADICAEGHRTRRIGFLRFRLRIHRPALDSAPTTSWESDEASLGDGPLTVRSTNACRTVRNPADRAIGVRGHLDG